ncbi:SDR family oxidoreductase [Actinoplanes sp. NBC_00393]|uniref:SDR family NAD(P)-dependent oxidoreductase n=1 Tax=Actinoplanes sp. NBC_00393 TaxID=2975953 RepID=UPI002E1BA3CE
MAGIGIVTGGGAGLGREIVFGLAKSGHGVVVADADPVAAESCARDVGELGVPAQAVQADIRVPADLDRVVRAAADLGGPRILVNNAGGWTPNHQYPFATAAEWTATIALNLTAPMLLSQLVLDRMRDLGGGAIINIASTAGIASDPYASPEYGAAKAGLIRFTTSSAGLADSHQVRTMCVVPDWIGLDRAHREWAVLSPAEQAATRPLIPPQDIVTVVLDLIHGGAAGTVVEMWGGKPPVYH